MSARMGTWLGVIGFLSAAGCGPVHSLEVRERPDAITSIVAQNDLKEIGLTYLDCTDSRHAPPSRLGDLTGEEGEIFLRKKVADLVREGVYVIRWNMKLDAPDNSKIILAYESKPSREGQRLVLKGNGSVGYISEGAFQKLIQ
jgi:hypothetical protein